MTRGRFIDTCYHRGVLAEEQGSTPLPAPRLLAIKNSTSTNADLTAIIEAWPNLPEAIREGMVAMVKAASEKTRPIG